MASGAPTEAEVQAQWRNAVDIIDKTQVYADSLAGTGQEFDVLIQSLEGDFTPAGLSAWAENYREGLSSLVDPSLIYQALAPCILEYGQVLKAGGYIGSGYETVELLIGAIYERFLVATAQYVESRAITFDTSGATTGTGTGTISRLTTDENAFDIENVTVETKHFLCVRDQNSGVKKHAEEFVMLGETRSKDFLQPHSFGSGDTFRRLLHNRNAGSTQHGSILRNSSFESYDATQTNDFTYWALVSGTVPTQETGDYYSTHPGASTDYCLTASAAFRLKQSRADMRKQTLDPRKPYFLRVMVKQAAGTPDGNVILHLGSQSVSVAATTINAATEWYELALPLDENSWFKNFNQDDFNVEIEWTGTTGTLLFDDMIFCELTQIDATWWVCRQNNTNGPTAWLRRDEVQFDDTQADTTKGKINYYLHRAGLGYLPSSTGTPTITFTDP
jgi:hypothetical protein